MKNYTSLNRIVFYLLLATGAFLMWLSFRTLGTRELTAQLKRGSYWICVPVFMVSVFGYYCRVVRWQLMLHKTGEPCRKSSLYAALCMGYAVNFAVPRLGEVSRCLVIRKTDAVKLDLALLTIVIERMIDTLTLALLFVICLSGYRQTLFDFINTQIIQAILDNIHPALVAFCGAVALLALVVLFVMYKKNGRFALFFRKYTLALKGLSGMAASVKFWVTTLLIWVCYFLMTYLWIFLFEESSTLGWNDALVIMVVGSFGRSIPIQGGGLGAYHFLVSQVCVIFGLSLVTGNALAIVIHGAQACLTVALGAGAYLWMLYDLKTRSLNHEM